MTVHPGATNAGGTFKAASQGAYRITGESRMVHTDLVAPNACAVDVQVERLRLEFVRTWAGA